MIFLRSCFVTCVLLFFFFFQAEDGIRDLVRSRGLGDVYKRQCGQHLPATAEREADARGALLAGGLGARRILLETLQVSSDQLLVGRDRSRRCCLLYTSDAADDLLCVDLGGRRIIKKKTQQKKHNTTLTPTHHSHPP